MGTMIFLTILLLMLPPPAALAFDPGRGFPINLMRDSRFCLTCHDGTIATNILGQYFDPAWDSFRGETPSNFCSTVSHSVGIDYRLAQLNSQGKLRDPLLIDPAVKLENGLVGCTSCHDSNSGLTAKLVMPNTGSRLCFACHNL